jgi:hypothetical protein
VVAPCTDEREVLAAVVVAPDNEKGDVMPKCEICGDTGYYRFGRSYKRCDCGVEPKKIPDGCHAFTVDADSPAALEMSKRVWRSAPPGYVSDRLPAQVAQKVAKLLGDCGARFVLCWEEGGNLHTIHGHDGTVFTGPCGGSSPQYDAAATLRRVAFNLRRALFEFGDMKLTSMPDMDEDTLEAAQADEACSRSFKSASNLEQEMFPHIMALLEWHEKAVRLRDTKTAIDESKAKG